MCGRYANFLSEQELIDAFEIATIADDARLLGPSWNVAPTQKVILVTASKEDPSKRIAETAKWGLVPSWAKDPSVGSHMINARAETVAEKPSFRSAFAKRRCLVPASGYYEWRTEGGIKTPHYIHTPDDAPLAFAGLYEFWRPRGTSADAEGEETPWLATCTIVTTAARDEMRELHDRQPVMLAAGQRDLWLGTESDKDTLLDVIAAPAQEVEWYAVGKAVGNVRNNSAKLLEPADS